MQWPHGVWHHNSTRQAAIKASISNAAPAHLWDAVNGAVGGRVKVGKASREDGGDGVVQQAHHSANNGGTSRGCHYDGMWQVGAAIGWCIRRTILRQAKCLAVVEKLQQRLSRTPSCSVASAAVP